MPNGPQKIYCLQAVGVQILVRRKAACIIDGSNGDINRGGKREFFQDRSVRTSSFGSK